MERGFLQRRQAEAEQEAYHARLIQTVGLSHQLTLTEPLDRLEKTGPRYHPYQFFQKRRPFFTEKEAYASLLQERTGEPFTRTYNPAEVPNPVIAPKSTGKGLHLAASTEDGPTSNFPRGEIVEALRFQNSVIWQLLQERFGSGTSEGLRRAKVLEECDKMRNMGSQNSKAAEHLQDEIEKTEELLARLQLEKRSAAARVEDRYDKAVQAIYDDIELEVVTESLQEIQEPQKKKEPRLVPFSAEQEKSVRLILHGRDDTELLISKFNVDMRRGMMKCLLPGQWLNDEVINFWFKLLEQRDENLRRDDGGRRSLFQNTFFHTKLSEKGYCYSNVRRWTRKVDIFSLDKIIIPVHVGEVHWCLAVLFMQEKKIQYYDSMNGAGHRTLKILRQYLADEHKDKKKQVKSFDDWQIIPTQKDTPQQNNGCDCGVFTCTMADYISMGEDLTFSQKNMPHFRERMAYYIVKGTLE